ncbi:MAG: hypothetical protein K6T63_11485 [Alicyclobacillus herbarius]|uniref:hypothetical protein n=1 Tax=Alicyclobacillus herbarius TaxID=122960 RepID=UPI0023533367|nr:hypothetical protein [Alicyclobacillus herbarius]MCL6633239.1 hypothetical protein [Alicyclobacillus herbarius]
MLIRVIRRDGTTALLQFMTDNGSQWRKVDLAPYFPEEYFHRRRWSLSVKDGDIHWYSHTVSSQTLYEASTPVPRPRLILKIDNGPRVFFEPFALSDDYRWIWHVVRQNADRLLQQKSWEIYEEAEDKTILGTTDHGHLIVSSLLDGNWTEDEIDETR